MDLRVKIMKIIELIFRNVFTIMATASLIFAIGLSISMIIETIYDNKRRNKNEDDDCYLDEEEYTDEES